RNRYEHGSPPTCDDQCNNAGEYQSSNPPNSVGDEIIDDARASIGVCRVDAWVEVAVHAIGPPSAPRAELCSKTLSGQGPFLRLPRYGGFLARAVAPVAVARSPSRDARTAVSAASRRASWRARGSSAIRSSVSWRRLISSRSLAAVSNSRSAAASFIWRSRSAM